MNYSIFEVANVTKSKPVLDNFNVNTNGNLYANLLDASNSSNTKTHVVYVKGQSEKIQKMLAVKGSVFVAVASYNKSDEGETLQLSHVEEVTGVIAAKALLLSVGDTFSAIESSKERIVQVLESNTAKAVSSSELRRLKMEAAKAKAEPPATPEMNEAAKAVLIKKIKSLGLKPEDINFEDLTVLNAEGVATPIAEL